MQWSSGSERGASRPPNKRNLHSGKLNGGNLVTGLVVGAGTLLLWPLIGPALRLIPKTAIEGGLIAYREAERHCQLSRLSAPFFGPARLERGSTIGGQRTFRPEPPRHRQNEHTTGG